MELIITEKPNAAKRISDALADGKAIKEKKPITVLDVTKEPEYKYPKIAKKEGICSMLAVPMMIKDKVIGVVKAYTTRVGAGPFPTEFNPALSANIRERGGEYGTTTGRARRCGSDHRVPFFHLPVC